MKKRFFAIILILAFSVSMLLVGCSDIKDSVGVTEDSPIVDLPPVKQAYPVSFGSEKFDGAPRTVASLSPALTNVLLDLGLEEKLIAVSDYCEYQKDGLDRIGSPALPDINKISELAPELLLTQSPIASADVIRLKQAGVRVLYIELPKSFAYLCEEYIDLALVFYGAVDSKDIAVAALSELDDVMTDASQSGFAESFVALGRKEGNKFTVMPDNCLGGDMLSVFGENLFGERQQRLISKDELSDVEPKVVFADESLQNEKLDDIFENVRIVYCDMSSFERPTKSLSYMMRYIKSQLEK